jgi:hypothetical protein
MSAALTSVNCASFSIMEWICVGQQQKQRKQQQPHQQPQQDGSRVRRGAEDDDTAHEASAGLLVWARWPPAVQRPRCRGAHARSLPAQPLITCTASSRVGVSTTTYVAERPRRLGRGVGWGTQLSLALSNSRQVSLLSLRRLLPPRPPSPTYAAAAPGTAAQRRRSCLRAARGAGAQRAEAVTERASQWFAGAIDMAQGRGGSGRGGTPLPVTALPQMSRPASARGMQAAWGLRRGHGTRRAVHRAVLVAWFGRGLAEGPQSCTGRTARAACR